MTTPVITVAPSISVKAAAQVLAEHRIAAAPVVEDGALVGMLSELDVLWGSLPPDPRAHITPVAQAPGAPRTVADVMSHDVLALPVDTDAADLLQHMRATRVRSIPIVEGDRVVGIVARRDLLRAFTRSDDEVAEELRSRLRESLPGAPWDAQVRQGIAVLQPPATGACADELAVDVALTVAGVLHVQVAQPT